MKENKFDFNALYKAVFESKKVKFDSERDYYTILLDFPHLPTPFMDKGKDYFGSLIEKIKLHVPDDAIEEVHIGEEEAPAELQGRLLRIKDVVGDLDFNLNGRDQPRCNFILTLHLSAVDMDLSPLETVLDVLKRVRDAGDEICLILTVPARMAGGEALLRRVSGMLPDYVLPFIFSVYDSAFRRHALLDSVGAAIILSSSVEQRRAFASHTQENARNVESYMYGLSEEGRKSFLEEPQINWMTMYCRYHDTKLDFLLWYCEQLRKSVVRIDDQAIMDMANQAYDAVHLPRDKKKSIATLRRSLGMIPRVDKIGMSRETNATLDMLFSRLYGPDGMRTVDFSLKATLSMMGTTFVEDGIAKGAQAFLNGIGSYECDDVYSTAVEFLQNYILTIQNDCKQKQKTLRSKMDDEHDMSLIDSTALPEYIEKYIELYDLSKKEDFWQDVLNYIMRKTPDCEAILARVAQRKVQLASIGIEFQNSDAKSDHPMVTIPAKKPDDILGAALNEAFCAQIGADFERAVAADEKEPTFTGDCSTVFALDVIPNTYTEFPIHFRNDTYSIEGVMRSGQYLIYLEKGES